MFFVHYFVKIINLIQTLRYQNGLQLSPKLCKCQDIDVFWRNFKVWLQYEYNTILDWVLLDTSSLCYSNSFINTVP